MGKYISLMLCIGLVLGENDKPLIVESLSWLTGSWDPIGENLLEETWLPPRAGTIVALVRSSNKSGTNFVEIIIIKEINGRSLNSNFNFLMISLKPINKNPHSFELTKIENNYISFKGVSAGSHKTLSYQRKNMSFFIRFQPYEGDFVEIRLIPQN